MEACVILKEKGLLNDTQVDTIIQTGLFQFTALYFSEGAAAGRCALS